jgi:hypothetical protein
VLWRMRARQSAAICLVRPLDSGALLMLLQDDEVVIREMFADAMLAEMRATALRSRLEERGWHALPEEP